MTVENLHDARELGWIIIELLKQGSCLLVMMATGHAILVVLLVLEHFFRLDLSLKRLIDRLVCVDNEGNNDVDKDQICQLHERDEVEEDRCVFFFIVD